MKYRLAGASYRAIAEKLTEERAQAYADEHGVRFERAMKKIPHVSKRTAWDDVTAELEELRRETEMPRADLMALENARVDQVFSKALSLFANGSVPAGRLAIATMGRRCLFVAGSLPVRVPHGGRPGLPAHRRGEHRKATGELGHHGRTSTRRSRRLEDKPRAGVEGGLELVALFPSPSHGFLVTERAAGTCGWRERAPWGRFGDRPADSLRVLDL